MFKTSSEEKDLQFIYLLVFWVIMSGVFYYSFFHESLWPETQSKFAGLRQLEERKKILAQQAPYINHLDTLYALLAHYNPSSSQVSLESNIQYELEELKRVYDTHQDDPNYKIFSQLEVFCGMIYYDKKAAWNHQHNAEYLKKNLQECEIGFQQKLNHLNIQEAIKSSRP